MVDAGPEFAFRSGADPGFPVNLLEGGGDLFLLFIDQIFDQFGVVFFLLRLGDEFFHRHIAIGALSPNRTVGPDVNLLDFADNAGLNLRDAATHRVKRRTLVAHLRANAVLLGEITKITSFADRTGQRLLGVGVLASLEGFGGDDRVHVVRSTNRDGVDLVHHFRIEFAVIGVGLGVRIGLRFTGQRVAVGVAQSDDFAVKSGLIDIARALAADADTGERNALKRGSARNLNAVASANHETNACDRRGFKEITTGSLQTHETSPDS